ncbi:uncharacterized protein LOC121264083 [Juglans microcarpa x Juglans regia]|uniref:uncharacterized protein LOC121264083 n=1 Tax=Juglans microcarpa x Juglans regia TaxID=2249226 RepID=UPI001B7E3A3F|nr:uncharacterized protein LOC121264083 [Juglans microcarpa x Juglans regia]XP_041023063.1 uncharacterized protein LOC121264083 [Juglans microcarpa x Juglans regia]
MELKPSITTFLLLFLLITVPYFSRGSCRELDTEVYEIDYRGPETHSSIPPPDRSRGKPPLIHRKTALEPTKSKGIRGHDNIGGKVLKGKKIQG